MSSNTCSNSTPRAPAASGIAAVTGLLGEIDRLAAEVVTRVAALRRDRAAERTAGITLEALLGGLAGLPGRDRWVWITVGEVLERMPRLSRLCTDGVVGWALVREITLSARHLSAAQQGHVDERLAATIACHDGIDVDAVVDAVDQAIDDERLRTSIERREQRRQQAEYVQAQSDFDGGSVGRWQLGPAATAAVLGALEAASAPPASDAVRDTATPDAPDADEPPTPSGRGRQLAAGLRAVCEAYLAGGPRRRARPSVHVVIDTRQAATHTPGLVLPAVPGPAGRLTHRALHDLLSHGATLRTYVYDHGHPTAVSGTRHVPAPAASVVGGADAATDSGAGRTSLHDARLVRAADIPAPTRAAVQVRDRGCRYPTCRAPAAWCDTHHLTPRAAGGEHHPRNLVLLCRRHHTLVHHAGCRLSLHRSGDLTAHHRPYQLTSWPRGTSLQPRPRAAPHQNSASGLTGDPVAPDRRMGARTQQNS